MAAAQAAHIGIILHDFSSGGSERIAIRLGNAWSASGRRVTLFCGTEDGPLRALVSPGVTVICTVPATRRSVISRLVLALRLAHILRIERPDTLFVPGNYHLPIIAVLSRMRFAKPFVIVCKLSNPLRGVAPRSPLSAIGEWVLRRASGHISTFVAMSPSLREQARTVLGDRPIEHIDEPVLDETVQYAPAIISNRSPLILCAGRLVPQKDFMLAIAAFAAIDARIGAKLLILGDGPDRALLSAAARRLGVGERVDFAGHVPSIVPYLAKAQLLLMTSQFEGYPAVLIEAIAAGVPVVTTCCSPAVHEIISSPSLGRIVSSRAPEALALGVETVLQAGRPDRSASVAATARHHIGASAARYLSLFDRLCRDDIDAPRCRR